MVEERGEEERGAKAEGGVLTGEDRRGVEGVFTGEERWETEGEGPLLRSLSLGETGALLDPVEVLRRLALLPRKMVRTKAIPPPPTYW